VVPKIRRLSLHRHLEKKKLEATTGVEHHVKFVAVTLNTALEVVRRKGESALFREERRGQVFVESSPTIYRFTQSRRRRVWKFVEPGVMG
jgi:hypothetical protein